MIESVEHRPLDVRTRRGDGKRVVASAVREPGVIRHHDLDGAFCGEAQRGGEVYRVEHGEPPRPDRLRRVAP